MRLKAILQEMAKETLNRMLISQRIKNLKLNGFGGECGFAAIQINNKVFGGKGKLVGANACKGVASETIWTPKYRQFVF